jgi:hypothetical protein
MAQILERKHESKPVTKTPLFDWRKHLKVHPAAELFPPLAPDELQALVDDIRANGLQQPIVVDAEKRLLDGRNRLDALALAGVLGVHDKGDLIHTEIGMGVIPWKYICRFDLDPYDLVLSYNIHRRHLTPEQKRDLIAKVLKAKPEQSNNAIAKQVKVDDKTVAKVRRGLESTSEIPKLEKTVGADGKKRKQPAKKTKPAVKQKTEQHLTLLSDGTVVDAKDGGAAKTAPIEATNAPNRQKPRRKSAKEFTAPRPRTPPQSSSHPTRSSSCAKSASTNRRASSERLSPPANSCNSANSSPYWRN